ncbi:hypothetical protein RRG08_045861 [Elysia crispata]|uniref:Uncharacterized protein n=1 Tax=Elysia crispata TaxID=231223 RepID=A0AAE0ZGN6_9GAST|nr:hypothetical protein RRG08_045861 [Elysia crispata]
MYPSVIVAITLLSSMTLSDARAIDNPYTVQKFPSLTTQLSNTLERIVLANVTANKIENPDFTPDDLIQLKPDATHLPDLPLLVETENLTLGNMEQFLRQTYRDVSIHIVFVQQALGEQIADDYRVLENELSGLEQKLFELLCKVHTLAISSNITISSFVDASVMPSSIKNIQDDTLRYMRNYILGKDTQIFLRNLEANFTTLYNEVQG